MLETPADDRERVLDDVCGNDASLREEIEGLIAALESSPELMAKPAFVPPDPETMPSDQSIVGQVIGPYKVLSLIGEGGMGAVYHAEQELPVQRRVALKLIKVGMDTKEVIARFEAERQALALMSHSNIAAIFDGGTSGHGRPYFAMEYVPGIAITEYCNQNRLTIEKRLELFLAICSAIQHAHQKGVIHRDIKPSNVLVCVQDGKPVPKVIDFGVAKAINRPLTERTIYTQVGSFIGTPVYTSPEQAKLTGLDVDTRTDVYSLGVLLTELLTGCLPFDTAALLKNGYAGLQRALQEDDPTNPSTLVSRMTGEEARTVSADRSTTEFALRRALRGDLDWITFKAMAKDRTRRYDTAAELAADVKRYLNRHPVLAGPPSAGYRLNKFVQRHRVGVIAGALGTAGLIVALVGLSMGFVVANEEKAKAVRVSQFLQEMLEASQPEQAKGADTTYLQEVLERASRRVDQELVDQPTVAATIHHTLGGTYRSLGVTEKAKYHFDQALSIRRVQLGESHPDTLSSMSVLGLVAWEEGNYDQAETLVTSAMDLQVDTLGAEHLDTLASKNTLAMIRMAIGNLEGAKQLFEGVLVSRERALGAEDMRTLTTMSNLARANELSGNLDEAERLMRRVVSVGVQAHSERDPHTLVSMDILGAVLRQRGKLVEAESLHRKALAGGQEILGDNHVDTLGMRFNLARLLIEQDKLAEGEQMLRDTLEGVRSEYGSDNRYAMTTLHHLAECTHRNNKLEEAYELYSEARDIAAALLPENHRTQAILSSKQGAVLIDLQRYDEAESLLVESYYAIRSNLGVDHEETQDALERVSRLFEILGRVKEVGTITDTSN